MSNTTQKVKMVKLESLCEQLRGISYKKSDATDVATDEHIPVLRANNIDDGLINFHSVVYVPKAIVKDKQIIKEGDVVIAASSGSISVVGKGAQATEGLHASFGAFCKLLRPNSKVNPRFFGHFFQSKRYRHIISNLAAGANINNLKNEHLNDLDFPDIPLPEQKRIAEILDLADEARRKRRENLKLYDDLIRSLFLQTFGDPVSNPMGWELKPISTVGNVKIGPFGSLLHVTDYVEGGNPLINPTHIINGVVKPDPSFSVGPEKYRELSGYHMELGDIVLGRRGEIGRCAVVDSDEYFCGTGSMFIRLGKKCTPIFLHQLISTTSMKAKLESQAKGITMKNLNAGIVERTEVIVPPVDLQNAFACQIEEINAQKAREQALYDQHDDLFNALLQRAFKGEL